MLRSSFICTYNHLSFDIYHQAFAGKKGEDEWFRMSIMSRKRNNRLITLSKFKTSSVMLSLIINTLFLTKQFAVEFRGNPELHEWYRSLTFSRASVHLNNLYRKRCLGFLVSSRFSSFKWDWARAHEWTFFCNTMLRIL